MKQSHKDTGEEQRFAQQLRDTGNILRPGFPCGQQRDGGRDGTREAEKYHAGLRKDTDVRARYLEGRFGGIVSSLRLRK